MGQEIQAEARERDSMLTNIRRWGLDQSHRLQDSDTEQEQAVIVWNSLKAEGWRRKKEVYTHLSWGF